MRLKLKMNNVKFYPLLIAYLYTLNFCFAVEVHFESADSGFFLKHSRQPPITHEVLPTHSVTPPIRTRINYDSVLSVDRFTVVQTTQAVSIRASYGPFSTKQTVPARYIVPDAIENQTEYMNNTTVALMELQQSNLHLDISAHLVKPFVSQDSPVLRVLFHAGADPGGHLQRQKICVLLHVSYNNETPVKGRCMPEGEDGVCVAEVVLPFYWFHSVLPSMYNNTPVKTPQRFVQVSYSVFEPPQRNPELCEAKVQIQPLTSFVQVPLVGPDKPFKEFNVDDAVAILLPQQPLYPMSKFHIPVFLNLTPYKNISSFTVKARVKSGIKILAAVSTSEFWDISVEKDNSKHTTLRVTAFWKKYGRSMENGTSGSKHDRFEVFSWLVEVTADSKELIDGGKIVWSVVYVYDNVKGDSSSEIGGGGGGGGGVAEENKKRIISKLDINKDDIQAVLPMAKNWELMNTAVLTGRQVAQAMKVFIVSQGGKVADVTLQSSCQAEDESVIKVSSSCSSVYVDGSEIRGSSNASIIVKYGTYIGLAKFIVWMPEFPLEVFISDYRLSQIKGWKVLDEHHYLHKKSHRKKRSFGYGQHNSGHFNGVGSDKATCRARYQQSPVDVYARFVAVDQNSGRTSYFISRRTGLCVTDLVQPLLRVADPKYASLKGRILQGKSMGRTDVQVLSPITGRVIGAKEIRVGSDKVNLVNLLVRVVSGLQLTITPDNTIENGYIAETAVTHKLTAQYQEGLLDIDLEFSDGSRTPLRDVSVDDYFLLVESLDTEVVAFAPMLASHHPRVIAVGEGNGNLLRVTLLLSEDCRMQRMRNVVSSKQTKLNNSHLATALAFVEVNFNNPNDIVNKHEVIQNDGIFGREKKYSNNVGDLADIIGIPLRDSTHQEPSIQARQHRTNNHDKLYNGKKMYPAKMSSMEIGMYVLLTAFCFAIIVFVISCVVYASKFKPIHIETGTDCQLDISKKSLMRNEIIREPTFTKESTTNAHDWVWLGRSTMDKSSMLSFSSQGQNYINPRDSRIRITANPFPGIVAPPLPPVETENTFYIHELNSENINCNKNTDVPYCATNTTTSAPNEYRPPIPPHRDIGTKVNNSKRNDMNYKNVNSHRDKLPRNNASPLQQKTGNAGLAVTTASAAAAAAEEMSELDQNAIDCFNFETEEFIENQEKHNAEILVESRKYKRSPFQFDTMSSSSVNKNINGTYKVIKKEDRTVKDEHHENATKAVKEPEFTKKSIKPESRQSHLKNNIKRATIVGNPMFSSAVDDDENVEENLSLDDLDMDYEQIMQYFDNLKESNA